MYFFLLVLNCLYACKLIKVRIMEGVRVDLRPIERVKVFILRSFLKSSSMSSMHVRVLVFLIPKTFLQIMIEVYILVCSCMVLE